MNRVEIKELAKQKIKGNKWNILWPLLAIGIIFSILTKFLGPKYVIDPNTFQFAVAKKGVPFASTILTLLEGIVTAGYLKYILNFVRTGKFEIDNILNTVKEKWLNLLIAEVLMSLIIGVCTILLVIPGIIMALAYAMVTFLVIDTNVKGQDALKQSREMMKGHKWEFFVFGLSFIGWCLLTPFTLGILLIWLIPYMIVAASIYYDKLSNRNSTPNVVNINNNLNTNQNVGNNVNANSETKENE